MGDFRKSGTETRISGRVAVGGSSAVLGRVKLFDESYTEGSILCVRGGERLDREALLLCPPIAIIVFCNECFDSLGEACSIGVPCLVLDGANMRCELCKNKVALIDTERGILTLDPSIDTIELYSSKRNSCSASLDCAVGKIFTDTNIEKKSLAGIDLFLADASIIGNDDAFEVAVGLGERFCPELLIFNLSVPKGNEGEERAFSELVESIYRAALYGSLAISLSCFDSEAELSRALRLLHKAFCILEAEGREFNAYLPRGITISSPLWLMRSSPVTNPDFIIFDLDTLLPSLFSLPIDVILQKEKALKKELFSVLEHYFLTFAPRCEVYLKTKYFSSSSLLRDLVRLANVKGVLCG